MLLHYSVNCAAFGHFASNMACKCCRVMGFTSEKKKKKDLTIRYLSAQVSRCFHETQKQYKPESSVVGAALVLPCAAK